MDRTYVDTYFSHLMGSLEVWSLKIRLSKLNIMANEFLIFNNSFLGTKVSCFSETGFKANRGVWCEP